MRIHTDICKVPGFPFTANRAAQKEYGYDRGHPLLRPYFCSPFLVRYYYWKKLEVVASMLNYDPRSIALDIGCGPGIFLPTLAMFFDDVIGIDVNGDDLKIAYKVCEFLGMKNVSLHNIDMVNMSMKKDDIGAVFAIDVFEHIKNLPPLIDNLYSVMKKGAMLVVSAPTENLFNDLARRSMGFIKPETHYHNSLNIKDALDSRFRILKIRRTFNLPRALSPAEIFLYTKI